MIAVISDIHGNYPALMAVLKDMPRVDLILCAGDLVGYYPFPNEVVMEIRRHRVACIRGNHDRAVINNEYSRFNRYAEAAAIWTYEHLDKENMDYLKTLRDSMILNMEGKRIAIHHGAPFNEDAYIYPEDVDEGFLEHDHADILILGHTHVPFIVDYGNKAIINPGSVGQPRDGNPKASYALMDLKLWNFEIRRVEYPVEEVERKIFEEGLPEFLAERLYYGF